MKRHLAVLAALALALTAALAQAAELPGPLVETDWLAKHLNDKKLVVLDVRADTKSFTAKAAGGPSIPGMNPCGAKKDKKSETAGHIPGARLWNWKTVRTKRVVEGMELEGVVPTKEAFEQAMRELGVNNDSVIDDQDAYWEIPEERVTGVRVTHGQIVVDKGLNPLPDSVPALMGKAGSGSPLVFTGSTNSVGSTVCR